MWRDQIWSSRSQTVQVEVQNYNTTSDNYLAMSLTLCKFYFNNKRSKLLKT